MNVVSSVTFPMLWRIIMVSTISSQGRFISNASVGKHLFHYFQIKISKGRSKKSKNCIGNKYKKRVAENVNEPIQNQSSNYIKN